MKASRRADFGSTGEQRKKETTKSAQRRAFSCLETLNVIAQYRGLSLPIVWIANQYRVLNIPDQIDSAGYTSYCLSF